MSKVNLHPTVCNLCKGKVEYLSNAKIYGKEYGSGKMYYCTSCGAYVGTHVPRPREALGILADAEMRDLKMQCHDIFDRQWKSKPSITQKRVARKRAYRELAARLGIPEEECHFGWFNKEMLLKALNMLQKNTN